MADDTVSIVIVGAGGHARVVADALTGCRLIGHVAPAESRPSDPSIGQWLGGDSALAHLAADGHRFALGIGFVDGDGSLRREELLARLGDIELATVQHPAAIVSPGAVLGAGTFIGPGAVVGPGARIGRAGIVNSGAIVEHDCRIGVNVHIAPRAVLSGGVSIGDHTLVGVGSTVLQGLNIGSRSIIGAGACVISDQPDDVTVVGVPARTITNSPGERRR